MDLGDNLRSASLDAGGNCRMTDLFAHNLSEHRALFQQLDDGVNGDKSACACNEDGGWHVLFLDVGRSVD